VSISFSRLDRWRKGRGQVSASLKIGTLWAIRGKL
jgi:hypothetical protein